MPIITSEIEFRLSGGASNSDPNASIGGAMSSAVDPGSLFDTVSGAESAAGDVEYRCIYVTHADPAITWVNTKIWLDANPSGQIAIGLGATAVGTGTEPAVANESTAPAGVTFSAAASEGAALSIGDIPAGSRKAVWLRRTITAGASAAAVTYSYTAKGDTAA